MQCLYRLVAIRARNYKTENKPIRDNVQMSAGTDVNSVEYFRDKARKTRIKRAKMDIN